MQQSEEQDFDFITFGYLLHNQPQSTIMAQTHLIIYFLFFLSQFSCVKEKNEIKIWNENIILEMIDIFTTRSLTGVYFESTCFKESIGSFQSISSNELIHK